MTGAAKRRPSAASVTTGAVWSRTSGNACATTCATFTVSAGKGVSVNINIANDRHLITATPARIAIAATEPRHGPGLPVEWRPMLILALETSTETGSCALWRDGEVLERFCPAGQSHSATLLPLVRTLLAEAGCRLDQVDGIAFGCGPGAFTGLRVACAAAQGLAVAVGLPVLPVVGLAAMAAASGEDKVWATLDARMGEVYAAPYARCGEFWQPTGEIRVALPDDVRLASSDLAICGNALNAYPALDARAVEFGLRRQPDILPTAAWIARQALGDARRGAGIDPALAAPLYIRDKVAKTVAERLSEGGRA